MTKILVDANDTNPNHRQVLIARQANEDEDINHSESASTNPRPSVLGEKPKPVVAMTPLNPISASATIVNLVLATGPFSYP